MKSIFPGNAASAVSSYSVIKEQLHRGIVEVVEKSSKGEVGMVHYIRHHAVIRKDQLKTKLRVVYASTKSDGVALNDYLYTGPPLAESTFDVLLRFRPNQETLTGDIIKAFLMEGMAEEDRDVLRFLWVDAIDKPSLEIVVLRFTRVVFIIIIIIIITTIIIMSLYFTKR